MVYAPTRTPIDGRHGGPAQTPRLRGPSETIVHANLRPLDDDVAMLDMGGEVRVSP